MLIASFKPDFSDINQATAMKLICMVIMGVPHGQKVLIMSGSHCLRHVFTRAHCSTDMYMPRLSYDETLEDEETHFRSTEKDYSTATLVGTDYQTPQGNGNIAQSLFQMKCHTG